MTAFNYSLSFTPQPYVAVCTLSCPKLFGETNNIHVMTISNKYTWLWRPNKHCTVFTVINVNPCIRIKNKNGTLLAIRYLKLLHTQWTRFFYYRLKPCIFKYKILAFEFLLTFCQWLRHSWFYLLFFLINIYKIKYYNNISVNSIIKILEKTIVIFRNESCLSGLLWFEYVELEIQEIHENLHRMDTKYYLLIKLFNQLFQ